MNEVGGEKVGEKEMENGGSKLGENEMDEDKKICPIDAKKVCPVTPNIN